MAMPTQNDRLTQAAYTRLQSAYDNMNDTLFAGELPPCLMTWQRGRSFTGYFSANRFSHRHRPETSTHEIALNPDHFSSDIEVMQTLVHEMVHLWQHVLGNPSQRTYHNKEWAAKMEAVGLMPSSTGKPGGAKTGQKISDYPIAGGPFEKAAAEFLATGPVVDWRSRPSASAAGGAAAGAGGQGTKDDGDEAAPVDPKRKIKYSCLSCGTNVWGKPGLNLVCGEDGAAFEIKA